MAASTNAPDWFELFNTTNLPVDRSDLYLTDDPSTVGLTKFRVPPLSFIGAGNWTRFVADNDPGQARHHTSFNLDAAGESLLLVRTNGLTVEGINEVIVSNPNGRVAASAELRVSVPLGFVLGPVTQTVAPGQRVTLSVVATGAPAPFSFEWRVGQTPITTNLTSRLTNYFTFIAPAYPTQMNFRAVLRNVVKTDGIATPYGVITVAPDSNGNGLPDPWETNYFGSLNVTGPGADADGDGASDHDENLAGTNPTNAASALRFDAATDANGVALSFLAVSNRSYAVEAITDLFRPTWLTLANLPARRTNHHELILEPAGGTNHFHRIVTPARP